VPWPHLPRTQKPSMLNEVCVQVLAALLGTLCPTCDQNLSRATIVDQGPTTTVTPGRFAKDFFNSLPFPANAWTYVVRVCDPTRPKCKSVTEAADAATLNRLGEWYKAVGVTVTKPFLSGKSIDTYRHRLAAGQSRPDRRGMEKLKSIMSGRRRRATEI